MKPTKKILAIAVASFASLNAWSASTSTIAADTIFYGGHVVTVNDKEPQVTALAIKDGNIIAVGNQAGILQDYVGDHTQLVDLKGRTLMPGFVEPHLHISLTAMTENVALNLSNFSLPYDTIDTILDKLKVQKSKVAEDAWIIGFGVDPSRTTPLMAELNADLLDTVSTTNPIFIVNQSGHIAYVNHKAMALAGINENTPNPGNGGVYVRDAQGKHNGVLIEPPSYYAFAKKMTPPSQQTVIDAYMKTVKSMAATGITTSSEMGMGAIMPVETEFAMVKELSHQPDFPIRVRAYLWGTSLKEGFNSIKPNEGDDRFRTIGVKYIADGSTQGLTAALNKPYSYPVGTTSRGSLDWEDEKLLNTAKPYFDQGWQISIHANGDRAIDQALGVYGQLLEKESDPAQRRLRIEHFTVNTDKEVEQAQKLGVAPSMTIGHVGFWGEVFHDHILGHERADRIDPTGSMAKRHIRFSFHSDSPVSPYGPLQYISTGASRLWQAPPRKVLGQQQRVAVDRAIKAVTLDAAYAMFMDDKVGSLEPGKWADLIILDQNPRTTDLKKIPQIQVQETWVNGKRVY
ncbi:MAG: amidohydrolase [Fluviibacter sp.]